MKFIHLLNSTLWIANAILWALYAKSPMMAIASALAAMGTFALYRQET